MSKSRSFTATTKHFIVRLAGLSYDQRTNRWSVTCRHCGVTHTPPTTMLAWQTLECPGTRRKDCGILESVNYNELMDDNDAKQ